MAMMISDTACVGPGAVLADEVEVGPYCVIGPNAKIGRGTRLIAHVYVEGHARLGERNTVYPFTVLGCGPHDRSGPMPPGPCRLEIGDENVLREGVVIQGGRHQPDARPTRIGHRNLLQPHAQMSAEGEIGDENTIGNGALIGHDVRVGSHVVIARGAILHDRTTIGDRAFLGPGSRVARDVPPYLIVEGGPARPRGLNLVGLKRSGADKHQRHAFHEAYRLLYRAKLPPEQAAAALEARGLLTKHVQELIAFLQAQANGRHGRARSSPCRLGTATASTSSHDPEA